MPRRLESVVIEIVDAASDSRVSVSPERGAIASSWRAHGREMFYLDAETLRDPAKNVRGGNPILFPTPGRLHGDAWARGGKSGALKQHGFARNGAWSVEAQESSRVTLALSSSDETRASYPWDFDVAITYSIAGATFGVDVRVTNRSADAMPFGFGFHPYFVVTDKAAAKIPTNATLAFDNVSKKTVSFSGFDLARGEVDMHLLDHARHEARLALGARDGGGGVAIEASPEFTHWVVWTLPGRDFVCLEPWTCPGDALNTGDRLLALAPGATRALRVAYRYLPA
jgi:galactose mutarotase-like enzyme